MNTRIRVALIVLAVGWAVGPTACAPYLPPTAVPAAQSPELESFRTALKTYIDETQPFRKEAAVKGDAVPNQASAIQADEAVRLRERTLAEAIQTEVRPTAKQGDLFSPAVADLIQRQLASAFAGPKADLIRDELQEQNEGLESASVAVAVNQSVAFPGLPPVLLETLPQLPQQVEFGFSGRMLILRDVDANVVIDFIPQAFPERPPGWSRASCQPRRPPAVRWIRFSRSRVLRVRPASR